MSAPPEIQAYFDEATNTASYLVADPASAKAAIIDPVLDFDPESGCISTKSVDRILSTATEQGLTIDWVLETHVHADHLSAAQVIKEQAGARTAIGSAVRDVQAVFAPMLGVAPDAADFDRLLEDGDMIEIGSLTIEVLATPGHTPACVSYKIGDAVFVGDTLFMPDYGTARTDFPGGDARQLYRSIRRILSLPPETRLFMCHDYMAPGRDAFAWETTVGAELERNVHIGGDVSEESFVAMRESRDATLCAPRLLYPSIQVNIRGGRLPEPEPDGGFRFNEPASSP